MRLTRLPLPAACRAALASASARGGLGGCVAVDSGGGIALPYTTRVMPRGFARDDDPVQVAVDDRELTVVR